MSLRYGERAERAAASLADLVRGPVLPRDPELRPVILTSRDIIIGALRDRCWNQFRVQVSNADPAATPFRFDSLQRDPVLRLAYVVEGLPRMEPASTMRPSEALTNVADPAGQHWVTAAKEMLLANHVLNTTDPDTRPWRTDPRAHAALTADTAQIVEAIATLDQRLHAVGALAHHRVSGDAQPASIATARLVASTIERLAQWVGDHAIPDRTVTTPRKPSEFDQPVHLVQTPADLIAAQRNLASYMQPMADRDLQFPYRMSAATALAVAHNQVHLVASLRDRIAARSELDDDLTRIDCLQDSLDQAVYATRGLHDTTRSHIHPLARGQQQEISVVVRNGRIDALSDQQASDLLASTEALLGTWAAALHREVSRDSTQLRVLRRGYIEETIYGRVGDNGPAARALTTLADHRKPRPEDPSETPVDNRLHLRAALTDNPPFEVVDEWPNLGRQNAERQPPRLESPRRNSPCR